MLIRNSMFASPPPGSQLLSIQLLWTLYGQSTIIIGSGPSCSDPLSRLAKNICPCQLPELSVSAICPCHVLVLFVGAICLCYLPVPSARFICPCYLPVPSDRAISRCHICFYSGDAFSKLLHLGRLSQNIMVSSCKVAPVGYNSEKFKIQFAQSWYCKDCCDMVINSFNFD